ncbi:HalOD1 output domain-containing protein [Haloarcula laminariae]|uniref:HalOD1 output domain-containing protein n=1 Tax=Haloarcula laminariae TaxID=2961577 RepID=UPI002404FC25|nr:HalOD1 output domain-containing protein [Halomicroarcula sp. FL173]
MGQQLAISYECTPVQETNVSRGERLPAVAIVEMIADIEETPTEELPVLADTIPPDVINTFVSSTESDSEGAFCFTYYGWNVFVRADGTIIVGDPNDMGELRPLF